MLNSNPIWGSLYCQDMHIRIHVQHIHTHLCTPIIYIYLYIDSSNESQADMDDRAKETLRGTHGRKTKSLGTLGSLKELWSGLGEVLESLSPWIGLPSLGTE